MRSVLTYTMALATFACATDKTPIAQTSEAIAYAKETDRAIDVAISSGHSIAPGAERKYQAALSALDRRHDAVERVMVRAEQQPLGARNQYVMLLAKIGHRSEAARTYLSRLALTKPLPGADKPRPHGRSRLRVGIRTQSGGGVRSSHRARGEARYMGAERCLCQRRCPRSGGGCCLCSTSWNPGSGVDSNAQLARDSRDFPTA